MCVKRIMRILASLVIIAGLCSIGSGESLDVPAQTFSQSPKDTSLTVVFGPPHEFGPQKIGGGKAVQSPVSGMDVNAQQGAQSKMGGAVPEPATMVLIGVGLLGLLGLKRRFCKIKSSIKRKIYKEEWFGR